MSRVCKRSATVAETLVGSVPDVAYADYFSGGPLVEVAVAIAATKGLPPLIAAGASMASLQAIHEPIEYEKGEVYTPAQARQLAALLIKAADRADALCGMPESETLPGLGGGAS